MRNGTYTAKRRVTGQEWRGNSSRDFGGFSQTTYGSSFGFSRNRNTIKFTGTGKFGKITMVGIFFALLLNLGLIYVDQSAKATSYDYQLSDLASQIDDLEAKKEDLAVEKARLTSIANSNNSKVASNMKDAGSAEYAE